MSGLGAVVDREWAVVDRQHRLLEPPVGGAADAGARDGNPGPCATVTDDARRHPEHAVGDHRGNVGVGGQIAGG
ncbi:hypothetical protein [Mycobacterium dioxanotrophicus]